VSCICLIFCYMSHYVAHYMYTYFLAKLTTLFHFVISTCFNRIDLPLYESKSDLKEKLTFAITMLATGFDME
jgi:hypothetical protein